MRTNDILGLEWVGIASPQLVLNARVSFSRYLGEDRGDANAGFDITKLGFPSSLAKQLPGGAFFGVYNFNNYFNLGQYPSGDITNTGASPSARVTTPRPFDPGRRRSARCPVCHAEFQHRAEPHRVPGWTQQNYAQADSLSGNSIASWLLGTPSSGSSGYSLLGVYQEHYYAPWVQDDWRINNRLTLNLGFRWDFNLPPYERFNRMNRGFDPNASNPVDPLIDRQQFPGYPAVKGGLLFAGVNGQPRHAADIYKRAIQPRAGFAYRIGEKLVVRGGWGRYYLNPNNNYIQSSGFNTSTPLVNSNDGGRTAVPNLISNPFPSGLLLPAGSSLGAATFVGQGLSVVNTKFTLPNMDQFSFGFQYELPHHSKVDASYVGSRGNNLQSTQPLNFMSLDLRRQCDAWEGGTASYCQALIPNPFYQVQPFSGTSYYTSPTLARATLTVPYPQFGGITVVDENAAHSWYNSFQATYEVRAAKSLTLVANWTLSKQVFQNGYNDIQRLVPQRSIYQYDQTHSVKATAVYQLPFGRGQRFFDTRSGLLSRLVSGWEANVLFGYHSGIPWRLPTNFIYVNEAKLPNINWSAPSVQVVQPCVAQWNTNGTITMQSFSTKAGCTGYNFLSEPLYAPAAEPAYSGQIRTMSAPNFDASLNKTTRITERTGLQFRAEVFNVTNTFNFYQQQPNSTLTSSAFGTVNKANVSSNNGNQPRVIQLSVKFNF